MMMNLAISKEGLEDYKAWKLKGTSDGLYFRKLRKELELTARYNCDERQDLDLKEVFDIIKFLGRRLGKEKIITLDRLIFFIKIMHSREVP